MGYVAIADHTRSDGSVDWEAYERASVQNGEECRECGDVIAFGGKGYPQLCQSCQQLATETGQVDHSRRLRCPECRAVFSADRLEYPALYAGGEADLICPECEEEFSINVHVSYTFTSPPCK